MEEANVQTETENEVDTTVDPASENQETVEKPEKADTVKEERVVPLAALHEERERRKDLDRRLREEAEKRAKMEARFEEWQKRQEPKEAEPDFDTDPGAWLRYQTERQNQRTEEASKTVEELRQSQQQQAQQAQFAAQVAATVNQFKVKTPDYMDAYTFWQQSVADEVRDAMGYEDPAVIAQEIANFESAIAMKAMQDGKNPGERLYAAAKRRGFKASVASDKIDRINKGQKASSALSQTGGRAENRLTLESLAEMSDEEFAKLTPAQWKSAMGG